MPGGSSDFCSADSGDCVKLNASESTRPHLYTAPPDDVAAGDAVTSDHPDPPSHNSCKALQCLATSQVKRTRQARHCNANDRYQDCGGEEVTLLRFLLVLPWQG